MGAGASSHRRRQKKEDLATHKLKRITAILSAVLDDESEHLDNITAPNLDKNSSLVQLLHDIIHDNEQPNVHTVSEGTKMANNPEKMAANTTVVSDSPLNKLMECDATAAGKRQRPSRYLIQPQ